MADDKSLWVRILGDATGAQTAMQQATAAVQNGVAQIREHSNGLAAVFSRVNAAMLGLGAVLGGGAVFRDAVGETVKLTKEAALLGRQFGITTSQASTLAVALGDVYVTTDQASAANTKITQALRTNEQAFTALGVATRDQSGHYRSALDVMMDTNAALSKIKEGTERNIAGQQIYGRSWNDLSATMRLTKDSMAAAQEKADELGLTVGQRGAAHVSTYRAAMNDVGDVITAVKKAMGDALLPVLSRVGNWFAQIGPTAVVATKNAMLGLQIAIEGIELAIKTVWNIVAGFVQSLTVAFLAVGDALNKALHGDFSAAGQALAAGGQQMVDIAREKASDIAKAFQGARDRTAEAMSGAWDKDKPTDTKDGATQFSPEDTAQEPKKKRAGHEFDSELADLNAQLEAYRNNMDAKIEIARQALARAKEVYGEDSREYAEAKKKVVEIERQSAEQIKAVQETVARTKRDRALAEIDAEEQQAKLSTEIGAQTKATLLQQEQQFAQQRYAIKAQAVLDAIALEEEDPDRSPTKLAGLHAELEGLELAHQARMRDIKGETVVQQSEWAIKFHATLQSGFNQTLQKFMQGQATVMGTLRSLFTNVKQAIVQTIADVMAKQLAQHVMSIILAKRQMVVHAALAAVHAAKSAAQIPFVGWALAIGAAAAVFAGLKSMSSAAGGYDIQAGVNPVTQLHQREMVLPAKHADVIRSMADGGGRGGGGETVHLHVNALDAHSVHNLFMNERDGIAKALVRAYRDGFPMPR